MMGSGVRISLAAPIQVLIGQTDGQGQQTLRHDLFLGVTRINRASRRLGGSAVAPSALTVRTSSRSRRPTPHCLSATRLGGQSISKPAVRPLGQPARPRACASLAVDRPIGPSLPQRANVSPAYPASSTQFRLGAKPSAVVLGREVGPTTRARTRSSPNVPATPQYACSPTQAAISDPIFTR